MTKDPSPQLQALYERVEKGIAWLTEHDPTGAFHLWYQGGLAPNSPMPAQDANRQADWRAYFAQRERWEGLWRQMHRLERQEGITA